MRDDVRPDGTSERHRQSEDGERPASDREVPIEGMQRDGEFWKAFNDQLLARRRMRAPAGLEARIMAAIMLELPG